MTNQETKSSKNQSVCKGKVMKKENLKIEEVLKMWKENPFLNPFEEFKDQLNVVVIPRDQKFITGERKLFRLKEGNNLEPAHEEELEALNRYEESQRLSLVFEDLRLVFAWQFEDENGNDVFIEVTHRKKDENDDPKSALKRACLILQASEIVVANHPAIIRPMWQVLREVAGEISEECLEEVSKEGTFNPDDPMNQLLIVTNEEKNFGAGCIFYPGVMEKAAEMIGGSFFILPSSRHEMILSPERNGVGAGELLQMVYEVNRTSVAPEDRLTDSVYHFNAVSKEFSLASTFAD